MRLHFFNSAVIANSKMGHSGKRQWLFRPIFISLPTSVHMQKFGEFVKSNSNSSCELFSRGIRAVSCFSQRH